MAQSIGGLETSNQQQPGNSPTGKTVLNSEKKGTAKPLQQAPENGEGDASTKKEVLSLADLFMDEHPDSEGDSGSDDPSKPLDSIDGLIKRHGLTAEQAYGIKVPMPNGGEAITIGELKDRVGELVDFETRELQFDQRRVKAEGELLRAQTEIRELISMIPREHVKPELVNKLRKQHEQTMARERELTLQHIPEWTDEGVRTKDLQGMIEYLSDYGFPEAFLETITDHRALKFIRDNYRRHIRIKAALEKVTIPDKKGHRPSGKGGKGPSKPNSNAPRNKSAPDQRSRIMNLLNSSEN